jgi:Tfp pilus assembly protein PilN
MTALPRSAANELAMEKSQALSLRQSLILQLISAVMATFIGTATAGFMFRSMLADRDTRITVLETHRDDDSKNLQDMRDDLKEIRQHFDQEHK